MDGKWPSDALALAVRVHVPIFVDEAVMDEAATVPEADVEITEGEDEGSQERLEVFKDFVETLDLEDIDPSEGDED
jgi:bifunctional DNase/RNase